MRVLAGGAVRTRAAEEVVEAPDGLDDLLGIAVLDLQLLVRKNTVDRTAVGPYMLQVSHVRIYRNSAGVVRIRSKLSKHRQDSPYND